MLSKANFRLFNFISRLGCAYILTLILTFAPAYADPNPTPTNQPIKGLTDANFSPGNNLAYLRCDPVVTFTDTGQKQVASTPSACKTRLSRLAMGFRLPGTKNTAALAVKQNGGYGQENVSFQQAGLTTWKETYQFVQRITNEWLNNHMDYDGSLGPLITDGGSGNMNFQTGDKDLYGTQDNSQNVSLDKNGSQRKAISSKYSSNREIVSDGACQMISMPGGRYSIKPAKDGSNSIASVSSDSGAGSSGDYNPTDQSTSPTITNVSSGPKNQSRVGNAIQSDVEQILDTAHPFSPRHYTNWTDRTSPSMGWAIYANDYPDSGGGGGGGKDAMSNLNIEKWKYTYTWVCGAKKFPFAYIYTHVAPKRDEAYIGGYDYYTEPMNLGGLILVNDSTVSHPLSPDIDKDRDGKFSSQYPGAWIKWYVECYAICTASNSWSGGAAWCQEFCKKVATESAEHELCRKIILPPVTPINHLKMAYNLAPQGSGTAQNPTTPGIGSQGPLSLNFLYSENRSGLPNAYSNDIKEVNPEYADEGMSFFFANPSDQFGFNMPPLKFWSTGLPANKSVASQVGAIFPPLPVDDTGGQSGDAALARLEPWRTAIAGVNRDYLPDESNDMEESSHDMSGQYGGWNELKLYETRCGSWFGLRCLCDYEKNFFRGTSTGYAAFFRPGGAVSLSNEQRPREQKIAAPAVNNYVDTLRQPLGTVSTDLTSRGFINWDVPVVKGNARRFKPILGQPQSATDSAEWPGTPGGSGNKIEIGLSHARVHDVIFFTEKTTASAGVLRRPWFSAYVEEVYGDGCLRISIANNGIMRDTTENTESWGVVQNRKICPPSGSTGANGATSSTVVVNMTDTPQVGSGGGQRPSCIYPDIYACIEEDWDKIKTYHWKGVPNSDGTYPNWDARQFPSPSQI